MVGTLDLDWDIPKIFQPTLLPYGGWFSVIGAVGISSKVSLLSFEHFMESLIVFKSTDHIKLPPIYFSNNMENI